MIVENPPDKILRVADVVAMFDFNVLSWNEVLVSTLGKRRLSPQDFMVVDIPVDSTDAAAVQEWRDRVERRSFAGLASHLESADTHLNARRLIRSFLMVRPNGKLSSSMSGNEQVFD
jgi:hypothetical protein